MGKKELVAGAVRMLYRMFELLPQRRTIALLSRQSAHPLDFRLLEKELAAAFPDYDIEWACVPRIGKLGVGMFVRQLKLVATSRACIVDGYVPAVSIPRSHRSTCVQLWHAMGAVKKFGYQCLDTPAGRSSSSARAFRMHRGYDKVVAAVPGALPAFREAFDVEAQDLAVCGLPRMDYLVAPEYASQRRRDARRVREQIGLAEGDARLVVLYAPTFRKGNADADWLEHNVAALASALAGTDTLVVVAGHPLEAAGAQAVEGVVYLTRPTIEALAVADVVVTDYSAVAFEAALAGVTVKFFVPDIEEYRQSPGLNLDPCELWPSDTFEDAADLARTLHAHSDGRAGGDFAAFCREYVGDVKPGNARRVTELLSDMIGSRWNGGAA